MQKHFDDWLARSWRRWGTATFHKMGREKINLIRLFVNMARRRRHGATPYLKPPTHRSAVPPPSRCFPRPHPGAAAPPFTNPDQGFDIMVSDVDTVWMRDPLEYVERYPEADILTSSDHLSTTVKDDGLEHYNLATSPANIGVMFVRKVGLELVNEWNDILEKDEKARHCETKRSPRAASGHLLS